MARDLTLYRYNIPFRTPFRTAKGTISHREGVILGDGNKIWSEIAPLPGYSQETIDDILHFLRFNGNKLQNHITGKTVDKFLDDDHISRDLRHLPSLRFGISMVSEQQKAASAGLPLFKWWHSDSDNRVRSNALLGLMELPELLNELRKLKQAGYQTVKLKLPPSTEEAYTLMKTLCRHDPEMTFRFDANGSFSIEEADHLMARMQTEHQKAPIFKNIAYLEEPLKQPRARILANLRKYQIPLASDESTRSPVDVRTFLKHKAIDALVLKPTLFGSFQEIASVYSLLKQSGSSQAVPVIISSSMETAIGRTLLAHIAAFFNTINTTDHGLATGGMFNTDIPMTDSSSQVPVSNTANCQAENKSPAGYHPSPVITLENHSGIGRLPDFLNFRVTPGNPAGQGSSGVEPSGVVGATGNSGMNTDSGNKQAVLYKLSWEKD